MNKYYLVFLAFLSLNAPSMQLRNGKAVGKKETTHEEHTKVPPILLTADMCTPDKIRAMIKEQKREAREYQAYLRSEECKKELEKYFDPEILNAVIALSKKQKNNN